MESQWIIVGLGVLGFLLTWTGMVVGVTKAITTIQANTSTKISEETTKINSVVSAAVERFEEDQRTQDNRFGEVALSIRQYVSNVEKEMHQIEIWGRDNFVLKTDFEKITERIEAAVEKVGEIMRAELHAIRDDIRGTQRNDN